jgi:MATE family multidrug resistance protein
MGLNGVLISIIITSFLAAGFLLWRFRMLDWRDQKAALEAA